jgi:hypothetical protein
MDKLKFLIASKQFIRKVVNNRKTLIRLGCSHINETWAAATMKQIVYSLEAISTYERMAKYIVRIEEDLRMLVPVNKKTWNNELEALLDAAKEIVTKELQPNSF